MTHSAISCVELSGIYRFLGFHGGCCESYILLGSSAHDYVCVDVLEERVV